MGTLGLGQFTYSHGVIMFIWAEVTEIRFNFIQFNVWM